MENTQNQDAQVDNTNEEAAAPQPKKIVLSEVIELLESGKDRNEIAEIYQLKPSQRDRLFDHPQLKGRRVHRPRPVNALLIEDDLTEDQRQEVKDFKRKQKTTSAEATNTDTANNTDNTSGVQESEGAM